jgi:hypothetical protein
MMKRQRLQHLSGRRRSQQGLTLFVALIMLVMVTLLVVSAFRVSNTNLKIVASMQGQQEAIGAAQAAIEQVLSGPAFAEDPAIIAATPITVDMNQTGGNFGYTVSMTPAPTCVRARPVSPTELNPNSVNDRPCIGSARQGAGMMASFCSNTIWEINATTTDNVTGASTQVRQGVSLRVAATDALSFCK